MSADGRRAMLLEVKRDLSTEDRAALNQYLIGALSVSVTDDEWEACVGTAVDCLQREQAVES